MYHYFSEDVCKFIVNCRTVDNKSDLEQMFYLFYALTEAKKYKCTKTAYKMVRELSEFTRDRPFIRQIRYHEDIVMFNCDSDMLYCYAKRKYAGKSICLPYFIWTRDETGWEFENTAELGAYDYRVRHSPVLRTLKDVSTDRVDVLNDVGIARINAYYMPRINYELEHLYHKSKGKMHDSFGLDFSNEGAIVSFIYGCAADSILHEAYKRKFGVSELSLKSPYHNILFGLPFSDIHLLEKRTLDEMFEFNKKNAELLHKILD